MFSLLESMNMSNCARHSDFGTAVHYGDFNMVDGSNLTIVHNPFSLACLIYKSRCCSNSSVLKS